jgi:proteasome alpha subunit
MAVDALSSVGGEGGQARELQRSQLEVAVLDRRKSGRTFRRVVGAALDALLANGADGEAEAESPAGVAVPPAPAKKDDPAPAPAAGTDARTTAAEEPGSTAATEDS